MSNKLTNQELNKLIKLANAEKKIAKTKSYRQSLSDIADKLRSHKSEKESAE